MKMSCPSRLFVLGRLREVDKKKPQRGPGHSRVHSGASYVVVMGGMDSPLRGSPSGALTSSRVCRPAKPASDEPPSVLRLHPVYTGQQKRAPRWGTLFY